MKKLGIIGAGDLGQQLADIAIATNEYEVMGFYDDTKDPGTLVKDITVLGAISKIKEDYHNGIIENIITGIGYNHMLLRKTLFESLSLEIPFASLIHPYSYIHSTCKIGKGVVVYAGCVLDSNVVVGDNTLLYNACTVSHDTVIGKHCFLTPRVALAGFVKIGETCVLGINTTVIDNIGIADGVKTGGGTVVIKDLNDKGLYVGNPARYIR